MTERRSYSREERAEAVALAASVGPVRAARTLGLPVRTVTNWTHRPDSSPIIAVVERSIAEKLEEVHNLAADRAIAALKDPSTPARDVAAIMRIAGEQLQLATGRATANVEMQVHPMAGHGEPLTEAEKAELQAYLEQVLHDYEGDATGEIGDGA